MRTVALPAASGSRETALNTATPPKILTPKSRRARGGPTVVFCVWMGLFRGARARELFVFVLGAAQRRARRAPRAVSARGSLCSLPHSRNKREHACVPRARRDGAREPRGCPIAAQKHVPRDRRVGSRARHTATLPPSLLSALSPEAPPCPSWTPSRRALRARARWSAGPRGRGARRATPGGRRRGR